MCKHRSCGWPWATADLNQSGVLWIDTCRPYSILTCSRVRAPCLWKWWVRRRCIARSWLASGRSPGSSRSRRSCRRRQRRSAAPRRLDRNHRARVWPLSLNTHADRSHCNGHRVNRPRPSRPASTDAEWSMHARPVWQRTALRRRVADAHARSEYHGQAYWIKKTTPRAGQEANEQSEYFSVFQLAINSSNSSSITASQHFVRDVWCDAVNSAKSILEKSDKRILFMA